MIQGKNFTNGGTRQIGRPALPKAPRAPMPPVESFDKLTSDLTQNAMTWIGQHPGPSVALAVAAGVFLGWLIKRR